MDTTDVARRALKEYRRCIKRHELHNAIVWADVICYLTAWRPTEHIDAND